jgi:prolyl 4-hydroxylase
MAAPKQKVSVRTIDANILAAGLPPPDIDAQTGHPKQLQAFLAVEDPEVLLVPNFLNDKEMDHMLELAENLWHPSGVQVGQNKQKQVTDARTSYSCIFQPGHTEMVAEIERRVSNLAGISVDYLEQLALVRYRPGEFFITHHDGDHRTKTVFIYLNDLPEDAGGHTVFPNLGVQFAPRKGCAVVWKNIKDDGTEDSRLIHAGVAPFSGVKYGVNCFFHTAPLKVRGVVGGEMPLEIPLANREAQDRKDWSTLDALELLAEDGQGQTGAMKMFTYNADPKFAIIPNCLSADEVAAMIRHHERSSGSNDAIPAEDLRILGTIQTRLAEIAGESLELLDVFNTSKYRPGLIPDGFSHTGEAGYGDKFGRKAFFIFLGEAKENQGGEVRFPRLGLQARPRSGTAVFWSSIMANGERSLTTAHQPNELVFGELHIALCVFGSGLAASA